MQSMNIRNISFINTSSIVLTFLISLLSLLLRMIKCANFRLIASWSLILLIKVFTSQNILLYLSGWYSLSTVVWHLLHFSPFSHLSQLNKSYSVFNSNYPIPLINVSQSSGRYLKTSGGLLKSRIWWAYIQLFESWESFLLGHQLLLYLNM